MRSYHFIHDFIIRITRMSTGGNVYLFVVVANLSWIIKWKIDMASRNLNIILIQVLSWFNAFIRSFVYAFRWFYATIEANNANHFKRCIKRCQDTTICFVVCDMFCISLSQLILEFISVINICTAAGGLSHAKWKEIKEIAEMNEQLSDQRSVKDFYILVPFR